MAPPPPATPTVASTSTEDATGKPPASVKAKLRKSAKARRKSKPLDQTVAEPAPATEPTNIIEALFGASPNPVPPESIPGPQTTAATDPITQGSGKIGKGAKSVKTARNTSPTATTLPEPDLFGADGAPQSSDELGAPTLSPANIEPLKTAIKHYTDIVAGGGWPTVPPLQMEVGTNNPAVAALRARLAAEGDLKAQPSGFSGPDYFDQDVEEAVRRFQARNGLNETGNLMDADRLKNGTRTVMALNVPAEARLAQLKANLIRLQQQSPIKGRYVLVNIPAGQIEAVENNSVTLRLNGVVGKPDRPSPLLSSNIGEVKFNPIWTVPPTVLKEDLIPKGIQLQSKGQDVLAKFGIDAYDGNGKKVDSSRIDWTSHSVENYRFSQQPSKDNPLGFAKLDFASPESVYMHDTPSAKLFDRSYRAASSGCIRVDHMERLVIWLLKETPGWSRAQVLTMKETGESKVVSLKKSVPLRWVYITAWATGDGTVHFRRDLYGKDQAFGVSKLATSY